MWAEVAREVCWFGVRALCGIRFALESEPLQARRVRTVPILQHRPLDAARRHCCEHSLQRFEQAVSGRGLPLHSETPRRRALDGRTRAAPLRLLLRLLPHVLLLLPLLPLLHLYLHLRHGCRLHKVRVSIHGKRHRARRRAPSRRRRRLVP